MPGGSFTRCRPLATLNSLTTLVPILEWARPREKVDVDSRNLTKISSGTYRCGHACALGLKLGCAAVAFDENVVGGAARAVAELTQAARSASDTAHSVALELQCMRPPSFLKSILFFSIFHDCASACQELSI